MSERRAAPLVARTLDPEAGTVTAVISAGTDVSRYGFRPDGSFGPWVERLALAGADLSRLRGAPVLLDHRQEMASRVGIVESAEHRGGELLANIRFSESEAGRAIVRDLSSGVTPQLSIGYAVTEWTQSNG